MNKLMDGKTVANAIYSEIEKLCQNCFADGTLKRKPKLVILFVGNDEASHIYIKQKIKACKRLGFDYFVEHHPLSEHISEKRLIKIIEKYNSDNFVDGILVQMPLPAYLNKTNIIRAISPDKDVDGLTPTNYGETTLGVDFERFAPCTAKGVVKMLEFYQIPIMGQKVTVIGSGIIAGKPVAIMLSNRKATVTICNSKTPQLTKFAKTADILISAVGSPKMITVDMVSKNAVIVDIGISRDQNNKISGDADFENLYDKVRMISPVPGGVGKLTVACLMENLLFAAINNSKKL